MISEYITKISSKKNLTYEEMSQIMSEVLSGKISLDETTDFLRNLTEKGETDQDFLQC